MDKSCSFDSMPQHEWLAGSQYRYRYSVCPISLRAQIKKPTKLSERVIIVSQSMLPQLDLVLLLVSSMGCTNDQSVR